MPRRDDDFEDLDPAEFPDGPETDLMGCPYCKKSIHGDSVRCHHCGQYLSEEDSDPGKPWWVILGAIVCLAVALVWALSP